MKIKKIDKYMSEYRKLVQRRIKILWVISFPFKWRYYGIMIGRYDKGVPYDFEKDS